MGPDPKTWKDRATAIGSAVAAIKQLNQEALAFTGSISRSSEIPTLMHSEGEREGQRRSFDFCTTHWSLVAEAIDPSKTAAFASLEEICLRYRPPLLAFLNRQGHSAENAEDLLHSFLSHFLERGYLRLADRQRGRFRTFLLTALKHFAGNEWRKTQAAKRGGGLAHQSLDELTEGESARALFKASVGIESAETIYDRKWAEALLARAAAELQKEWVAAGKSRQFTQLSPYLSSEPPPGIYASIADSLGCAPDSVAVTVLRMRRRLSQLFRQEVALTVAESGEVDEEYKYLVQLLVQ